MLVKFIGFFLLLGHVVEAATCTYDDCAEVKRELLARIFDLGSRNATEEQYRTEVKYQEDAIVPVDWLATFQRLNASLTVLRSDCISKTLFLRQSFILHPYICSTNSSLELARVENQMFRVPGNLVTTLSLFFQNHCFCSFVCTSCFVASLSYLLFVFFSGKLSIVSVFF
jgi:hypothetical protein